MWTDCLSMRAQLTRHVVIKHQGLSADHLHGLVTAGYPSLSGLLSSGNSFTEFTIIHLLAAFYTQPFKGRF